MAAASAGDCFLFPAGHRLPARYGLGAPALRYAALGYAVIPLARGGKRPHAMLGDRGGIHLASRDPEQIREWWSLDMAANIGVATGSANNLAVVDLDVKRKDANGVMSFFSMLEAWALPWPDQSCWVTARTPSGGEHLWLRSSATVPERPGILPGVDVKGDGGLVVAPPSMQLITPQDRSGGTTGEVPVPYEWVTGCPHAVPVVPPWFSIWLDQAPSPHAGSPEDSASGIQLGTLIEKYLRDGVPEGQRNREIYRIACRMFRQHGTDMEGARRVRETVRDVYDRTDQRGFPWREVQVCIESARRFVERRVQREALPQAHMESFSRWLERRTR